MSAVDEYQRVLLDLSWPVEDAIEAAQALAADPGVRAAVEREARAEAWDEGYEGGQHDANHDATGYGPWEYHANPYRQEPSDGE